MALSVVNGGDAGEVANAWARIRRNLRESAGARLFEQWLKPIELGHSDDATNVRLTLPSAFTANWVRNHYQDRLVQEFRAALPAIRSVSIEVRSANAPAILRVAAEEPAEAPKPAAPAIDRPALDPRLTFDRFVVDPSNRVAYNAAKALAEPGKPRFSPLFLHSATGLGKTHLMHAIGHAYLAAVPDARVILMSAERFMFEFVAAIRANDTHAFKARLRGADLLMIDDLHFISGKKPTQDEFFHTINELTAAGKRLVITADRSPQGLDDVEARIVSRLAMGLVADIKTPDGVLRRALIEHRLGELDDVRVPGDVIDLLSAKITGSLREVEGALNRLVAYAQLTGEAIDLDFAQSTLGDVLRGGTRRITIDEIQRAVSTHYDLKPVDLVSARRAVVVARPRQIAMYLAKRLTTRSLPEIGRKFGGRDHSTVIHAVRRIEELRGQDHEIDGAVKALLRQLEG
ncbi:MAG: chromosomal replication initiator protein DnaA [Sphingomonas sp.]|uniref:chromosomal replication initiator protein DnaA n=1 Tax=Sphingomonas sp. TaxID=28214 RepID=UPI001ACD7739|nr:chromosomal replication initiator protein DnaA [Sphingomonas sp.]MBN8806934.1 chromosomal replication initiator protein DnaA [Sphingomonas sp.]